MCTMNINVPFCFNQELILLVFSLSCLGYFLYHLMLLRLVLKKEDLDDAFSNKKFPEGAKVEMLFERDRQKGNIYCYLSYTCMSICACAYVHGIGRNASCALGDFHFYI